MEPSVSELEQKLRYLHLRVATLKQSSPRTVVQSGDFIPAGTVFFCRPSKFAAFVERLGGTDNVEIVDTDETEGFCRGATKPVRNWTYRVYPTDIGPSCAGITARTGRITVRPTNNCITPTAWDPLKMFGSGNPVIGKDALLFNTLVVHRVLWIHKNRLSESLYNSSFRSKHLFDWPKIINPYTTGNTSFPENALETKELLRIVSNYPEWSAQTEKLEIYDWETNPNGLGDSLTLGGLSTYTMDRYSRLLIEREGSPDTGSIYTAQSLCQWVPYQLKLFEMQTNRPLMFGATPKLVYGGYSRTNPPGQGPPPAWGRTNLVQIKTKRDVFISVRTSQENENLGGGDLQNRKRGAALDPGEREPPRKRTA